MPGSARSPSMNSMASRPARLARLPVMKLSTPRTDSPRASRAAAMERPMNPAAPVTTILGQVRSPGKEWRGSIDGPHELGYYCNPASPLPGLRIFGSGRVQRIRFSIRSSFDHDSFSSQIWLSRRVFPLTERLLFLALAAASVYGFWRRFGPILSKILQSKKDPDFHLFPIGRRVRDFVWEVMLQAKVIRERPLAGVAHALVFWAFCAFALVTLNHCATIFGLGFLDPAGRVGRFYFYFAAVFAVACAVGISGCSCGDLWCGPSGWAKFPGSRD